ncbi:histidine phosphatase family protein [bacterium]|nr:histidine phosphatase family protein [bacterium]
MRLIVTRHGQTEENKKKIFQGHLPGKLSELGIEQAQKLALRLKNEKIDVIFSSDLARASDTAKEIAKYHKGVPLIFVEELREKDLGKFTGKSWSKIGNFDELINDDTGSNGVETRKNVELRVKKLFDSVFSKYRNSDVLFVGHNGTNKILMRLIMNEANLNHENLEDQHNTAVNIFQIKEDKNHKIHVFNCKKHLD